MAVQPFTFEIWLIGDYPKDAITILALGELKLNLLRNEEHLATLRGLEPLPPP